MRKLYVTGFVILALLLSIPFAHAETSAVGSYEISITNLTRGQGFSPPVIATRYGEIKLFEVGTPASPGITAIAEDGIQDVLAGEIKTQYPSAKVVLAPAPIPPGQTGKYIVRAGWGARFSVASMLGSTNDAFLALQDTMLKPGVYYVSAYDAGSEANNESCSYVPGPPCAAHNVRMPAGSEGYVHIHAGIKGVADLPASSHDWNNPVAKIEIRRAR